MMTVAHIALIDHGTTSLLEYALDWTEWLKASEPVMGVDEIASSEWAASDASIPISGDPGVPDAIFFSVEVLGRDRWYTTVWVGAIPEGSAVTLTNRVTTTLGRIEERSIQLTGVDR